MTNDIKQQVRTFLLDNFLMGGDRKRIADTDSFMELRLLDSTGFIELVTFVEQQFCISVGDEEMLPDNLDSLERIAAYVSRKRAG